MRKNNLIFKWFFSCLLICCLFSITFAATSQKWRDILNQLRNEWRTDEEIKAAIEDLWYSADEYFPQKSSSTANNTTVKNSKTTQEWRNILNELKKEWWTDEEIKIMMEDLWLDTSGYFSNASNSSSTSDSVYTSRSCKVYNIEYISTLWAYTSPDLKNKEYFINSDYFKRYIDSKNPQKSGCPSNGWRINTAYNDSSNSFDRYTAPNWKIYFITNQNWLYTSNELSKPKNFSTINELKNYIRDRNPLVWMWIQSNYTNKDSTSNSNNANETMAKIWSEIFN